MRPTVDYVVLHIGIGIGIPWFAGKCICVSDRCREAIRSNSRTRIV